MIGAMLGDIAGSRFEFSNNRVKPKELFTDECFPTDDSYMTAAVFQTPFHIDRVPENEANAVNLANKLTKAAPKTPSSFAWLLFKECGQKNNL